MLIGEGALVDGKFELISSIGIGGMGVVYEARQLGLDRFVALKLLSCVPSDATEEVVRFEREALVLSKLQHINIVQFYAFGVWQHFPYIAMERVSGISLQRLLADNEPQPTAQIIDYAMQICDGLEHAHAHSVFHRDIKPSNIIISDVTDGRSVVKLIDFGLAKLTGVSVQKLTQTNTAVGSVMYMSPEQCVGKKVDARADIYSLGCLLYHCFTGEPPYFADNAVAVMFQQTNEPVENCRRWKHLPEAVQAVIARCMSKDPEQRYQSCAAVKDDLKRLSQMELKVSALPQVALADVAVATGATMPGSPKRSYVLPAMVLSAICLTVVYALVTSWYPRATAVPTALNETPKETVTRFVRRAETPVADAESARQLSEALRQCAKDSTIDQDVLLVGYQRLLSYYLREDDGSNVRAVAREALEICSRSTKADVYGNLLINYHQSCESLGCELSLVNQLEQTLMKFPNIGRSMKVTLSLLLARDYFRLGREGDAAAILDKVVSVTEGQPAEIANLRRLFGKATGLVADIAQRRKDHQSAAASSIDLSSCYLELEDGRSALSVLEQELQRRKENSEYDLLRMREAIARAYLHLKDYQKTEEVSQTLVQPYADHIGNPDWPGVTDHLNAAVYYLCYCYLRDGRYEKCADLGDRWAKHRDANANFPSLREEIDVRRANAYRHVGRLSDAEKIYKSVAAHTDMSLPATPNNYCDLAYSAVANDGLACTYYHQAKYQAALKHAKISIELNAKVNNNMECAFTKMVLAQCLQKLDRSAEASILKAEALKVLQNTDPDMWRARAYYCDDVVSLDSICPQSLRAPKIRH